MANEYRTSEGVFNNTPLEDIFDPRGSLTKIPDVGIRVAGSDISNLYAPIVSGSATTATGIRSGGADLNTLFAGIGTVSQVVITSATFTGTSTSPANSVAGWRTKIDGSVERLETPSLTWFTYGTGVQWLSGGGSTTDYSIRATTQAGAPGAGSYPPDHNVMNDWLNLGTLTREWRNVCVPGTPGGESWTILFEIRRNSDFALMDTATITLIAQNPVVSGGGGGGSVSVYAYMPNTEKRAGDMIAGDELTLLSLDREGTMDGTVINNRTSTQTLLTLVSESGIRLTCSDNTPLTLRDGSSINSTDALGQYLPVEDQNGFRWEKIVDVENAGRGQVATIYCEDQCYAAGDEPGRWIWTHNMTLVKN